ncbi:hypothetical protein P43SY_006001 [Pythium insidiosum]|uniref:Calmodulin n=1 Tax=Pythium insidiosum TaxID=114742 RepID=A0AAD5Q790_PYTIN|nr:hypothetical protein P43SY_006001 [Pythium insidiosum]
MASQYDIDDLYDNNTYDDDAGANDSDGDKRRSFALATGTNAATHLRNQPKGSNKPAATTPGPQRPGTARKGDDPQQTTGVDFNVWVARKDKYERVAVALSKLNTEREITAKMVTALSPFKAGASESTLALAERIVATGEDQKKQNAFFLTLCKKYWKVAQLRVVEHLQQEMEKYEQRPVEQRKRLAHEHEAQILQSLGVKRMLKWVEDDQEAIENTKKEEQREKAEGGIVAHNAWVKRKDRLRIRMPTAPTTPGAKTSSRSAAKSLLKAPPPRMDFSSGKGVVRQKRYALLHRRGVNYREAFLAHCDKKHRRLVAAGNEDIPEEMTEDEKLAQFASLDRREFAVLLRDVGIVLQPEEVQRVTEYFDTDGDQRVSMTEFLAVVGDERDAWSHGGDTEVSLRQVCLWETVCHECGMLHAFQLVLGTTKPGEPRMRAELPGHVKRRTWRERQRNSARAALSSDLLMVCTPECDMQQLKKLAPKVCAYASWTDEQAAPYLKKLELWSAELREHQALRQLVADGAPPDAPALFRDDSTAVHPEDESIALDPTTTLLLRWTPPPVRGNNDTDGDGVISRDELMEEIERRKPRLLEFLQRTTLPPSASGGVPLSVFDAIETDDNETISWDEFQRFFHSTLDDGSVDFRAKFDHYDVDKSGFIELPEFQTLVEELGVAATPERMAAYLDEFDRNGDGKVSFDEFQRWWTKTDVQYVLKRDAGTIANGNVNATSETASAMSVVCYRGKDTATTVSGLAPNTEYRFRLRTVSSHASSQLSDALVVCTPPEAPTCPGVISVLATGASICWYPGRNGAAKYLVECKFIETLPSPRGSNAAKSTGSEGWIRVYEGGETIANLADLVPNSVYRLRIFALNRTGSRSEQSTVAQLCTLTRDEERHRGLPGLRAALAADLFTIECSSDGDIVAGDTILFSERLVRTEQGKVVSETELQPVARGSSSLATSSVYSTTSYATVALAGGTEPVDLKIARRERALYRFDVFRRPWQDEPARHASTWDH